MAQVKFYSVANLPEGPNAGGVYFVDNGELYKGSQRFGLGRVTVDAEFNPSTSSKDGQARGDIVVTGSGAGWVYAGSEAGQGWQKLGGDIGSLQSMWQADISTWTAGLVAGGEGSYITGITQNEEGKVTAQASNFADDVKAALGSGTTSSSSNGITVSVTVASGSVTNVEVAADNINCNSVTASTATFTNLTVSDTANFTATEVSAGSLTVGGVSVNNVSASTASDNDAGVAVTVGTENGGVKTVDVAVTGNLATFAGKSVVTTVGPSTGDGAASNNNIATEKAVRDALNAFDNAMHFRGVVTSPSTITDPQSGDIVVIGSEPATGYVTGQEFIWDGTKWEKIGDQSFVTGGSSTSTVNNVSVQVVTAAATAAPTVTLTGVGTAAQKDYADAVTANAATLPTCSAVATYVTGITDTKASVGTSTTEATHGVSATVTLASNVAPTIGITVDAIAASAGVATGEGKVVTAGAVADYVTGTIAGLDANVSSGENNSIKVGVTQVDGVVTGVTADLMWLDASGSVIS